VIKQDTTLVKECLSGNRRAWEELVKRYSRLIYGIALRRNLSEDDAADVFQTVCIKLLANLEKLKDDQHLLGWMITTAKHECSHLLRQRQRHQTSLPPVLSESILESRSVGDVWPDDLVMQLEEEHLVHLAVADMNIRCRQLIELLYLTDPPTTYLDVSRRLDIPSGSIGPTRARCLKGLKEKLMKLGF